MVKPEEKLKEYLWKLIERYSSIKLYKKQLDIINAWKGPHRIETLNKGGTFFKLVTTSFTRTMLIELCLLVSPKEQFNIYKWLEKVKTHSKSLKPTMANKDNSINETRIKIKPKKYLEIIDGHIKELSKHQKTIDNLIKLREKIFTHYDSSYFNNPKSVYKKYHIDIDELNNLMLTIEEILSSHHSYLFASSISSFDVASYSNVNMILTYTRAFMRIRKDKKLIIEKGFRPADYLKEIFPD